MFQTIHIGFLGQTLPLSSDDMKFCTSKTRGRKESVSKVTPGKVVTSAAKLGRLEVAKVQKKKGPTAGSTS